MFKRYRLLLSLTAALLALFLSGWLYVTGTVMVVDSSGAVVRAEILGWHGPRPLRRLPGGLFIGLPSGDGSVRIHCRGGAVRDIGYVSGAIHTWVRVPKGEGCAGAREIG